MIQQLNTISLAVIPDSDPGTSRLTTNKVDVANLFHSKLKNWIPYQVRDEE